jgi:hypothetical protein
MMPTIFFSFRSATGTWQLYSSQNTFSSRIRRAMRWLGSTGLEKVDISQKYPREKPTRTGTRNPGWQSAGGPRSTAQTAGAWPSWNCHSWPPLCVVRSVVDEVLFVTVLPLQTSVQRPFDSSQIIPLALKFWARGLMYVCWLLTG